MLSLPNNANGVSPNQPCEDTREVIYLVKRSNYILTIAAPRLSPTHLNLDWEQAVLQVRLKSQGQLWSCKLNPPELEAFYEDLRRLVKYLQARRE